MRIILKYLKTLKKNKSKMMIFYFELFNLSNQSIKLRSTVHEPWTSIIFSRNFYYGTKIDIFMIDILIYVNTKVRCKPRNMTNFNQKVKILKTLNFCFNAEM